MNVSSISAAATQQAQAATLQSASNVQKQDPDHDGDIDPRGVEQAGETASGNTQSSIPGATGNNINLSI